jgi:hypothetical protein
VGGHATTRHGRSPRSVTHPLAPAYGGPSRRHGRCRSRGRDACGCPFQISGEAACRRMERTGSCGPRPIQCLPSWPTTGPGRRGRSWRSPWPCPHRRSLSIRRKGEIE